MPERIRRLRLTLAFLVAMSLVPAFLLASCAAQRQQTAGPVYEGAVHEVTSSAPAPGTAKVAEQALAGGGDVAERRVVKKADMTVDVEDAVKASATLGSRAEELGGFVAESTITRNREGRTEAHVTLRVPAAAFISLLDEIEKLGTLLSRHVESTDVTEEYVDLQARLENLKFQEKRLQEIVSQANTVEDLLKVEKELERVRGEIESLTARFQLLKSQCDYSAINVYLRSTPLAQAGVSTAGMSGLWGRAVRALYNSLTVLISGAGKATVALFSALPFLALFAAIGWAVWRLFRHRLPRGHSSSPGAS